jgi:hypothetical protein
VHHFEDTGIYGREMLRVGSRDPLDLDIQAQSDMHNMDDLARNLMWALPATLLRTLGAVIELSRFETALIT